ncbi:MAG TPA: PDZ domain-containing protein [Thermoanaerobaculia bacterium]|jgi:S1-C subfamily serine protease
MKSLPIVFVLFLAACAAAPPSAPPAPVVADAMPQPPGYLGFGFSYHKPDAAQSRGGWLMVRHVPDDGPAYRAGLTPQTVITAIDGQPLTFPDDLAMLEWLKTIRPGQSIRLTIAGENPRELTLVAAELPPDKLRIWKANFEPAPQPGRPPS